MELGIKGLRVLVTAGANGIGREVARAFAGEGAKVHVCDIDPGALRRLARSDPKITRTRADVADRKDVERLFRDALKVLGRLDVLVNNAGMSRRSRPGTGTAALRSTSPGNSTAHGSPYPICARARIPRS